MLRTVPYWLGYRKASRIPGGDWVNGVTTRSWQVTPFFWRVLLESAISAAFLESSTRAIQARFPTASHPGLCMWKVWRALPVIGIFSGPDSPLLSLPPLHFKTSIILYQTKGKKLTLVGGQSKEAQDTYLAGCMNRKLPEYNKVAVDPKVIIETTWNFQMKKNGSDVTVCKAFVIDVHKNSSFEEKRGEHGKQKKLENGVWQMVVEHLKVISYHVSHYTSHRIRLYFDNPDLTIKGIYGRKQMCVTCTECEKNLENDPNHPRLLAYKLHKKKAERYLSIKNDYIDKCKEKDDIITLEFDCAQNLLLPMINITKQLYKRLLWIFVFNVHCHNDNSSSFYTFLERISRKSPNTVALFIFNYISEKVDKNPNIREIVLLSDAADTFDTELPTVSRRPTEAENGDADFDLDNDNVMEGD
ncbi:hypothetical protein PR048_004909 [Dryococelus australis]|uniref:Uncharacterized protein n=1 Tax=Dryococelus australis TaxID=614101 RepID=A0ABQ9I7S6_9NEOP|nr:hypothetical protein PR048_004909 [Dryococelus australis]